MFNERNTEKIVRKMLKDANYDNVDEQVPSDLFLRSLLKNASKKPRGKGRGFPEFIVYSEKNDIVVVIECKADKNKHVSDSVKLEEKDKFLQKELKNTASKYAVDGVLWYSQFLKKHFNIVAIGVSGQSDKDVNFSCYLIKKFEKNIYTKMNNDDKISELAKYVEEFSFDINREKEDLLIEDCEIYKLADGINNQLRDSYEMDNYLKPILVSMLLMAMKEQSIQNFLKESDLNSSVGQSDKWLFNKFHESAKNILRSKVDAATEEKINLIIKQFEQLEIIFKNRNSNEIKLIKSLTKTKKTNSSLLNTILDLYRKVYLIIGSNKYTLDPIGTFYSRLLRYSTGEGKNLGIVLTPNHITDLFVDFVHNGAGLKKDDKVIDICAGSGGFIISAYKKLINSSQTHRERKKIKEESIFGIEIDPKMFVLAMTNMILMGDGKTNLYFGDCMKDEILNKIKNRANIGFINPPYSKSRCTEFDFIQRIIQSLGNQNNSEVIAIIPLSVVSKSAYQDVRHEILKKHTLEAVISMPNDLFYPATTPNTCIIVLKPNIPHNYTRVVWMGKIQSDGFEKLKGWRVDKDKRWKIIKKEMLDAYKNKFEDESKYIKVKIDINGEWAPEAYLETNLKKIENKKLFIHKIKDQLAYRIKNDLLICNELNEYPTKYKLSEINTKRIKQLDLIDAYDWKKFKYSDVFDIKKKANKHNFTIKRLEKSLVYGNEGDVPYVSSSAIFHGITLYISKDITKNKKRINLIKTPVITLANSGSVGSAFLHEKDFFGTDSIYFLGLKNKSELDVFTGIFLTSIMELEKEKFNFGRAWRSNRLLKSKIWLPIDENNNIDFEFMRNFVKKLSPYSCYL